MARAVSMLTPVSRVKVWASAVTLVSVMLLSGCGSEALADQYREGTGKNYIAGDGTITEIPVENRTAAAEFTGALESGAVVSEADYHGDVLVLNFWYAGCAPCRAEAPILEELWQKYEQQGVQFLGVNVRDQVDTALAFSNAYGVTYPSVMDTNEGTLQLAFSGVVAPNAVPTTLVVDRQGRVASRILGGIPDGSILNALITSALNEEPS